jgi:Leucine-rich repeat (LRR) protein
MLINLATIKQRETNNMTRWLTAIFLLMAIAGCSDLDFKINETTVYSPRPLLTDFEVADAALQACLEQAIIDQKATVASELLSLNCSHAQITNLDGLELFNGLIQLRLSSNQIRNLAPLVPMSSLESLYLENNLIIDPVPLYELLSLAILDLSGNPSLQCPSAQALLKLEEITLPEHCQR